MNIVVCKSCGNKLHVTEKCMYCGSSKEFSDSTCAANDVDLLQDLLKKEDYNGAIEQASRLLQQQPKNAELFWIRLLAKNKCKNDVELLQKGFSPKSNVDYLNAVKYATQDEKEVYLKLGETVERIKNTLETYVREWADKERKDTLIVNIQISFSKQIFFQRKKLFELFSSIEEIEKEMYEIEKSYQLQISEHKEVILRANGTARDLRNEVKELKECSSETFHKYTVCLNEILAQSEKSKNRLQELRSNNIYIEKLSELQSQRDAIVAEIDKELSDLSGHVDKAKLAVAEFENIEKKQEELFSELTRYNLEPVKSVLGMNILKKVWDEVGLFLITAELTQF